GYRQLQVHVATGEILDRRDFGEQLFESLAQEPFERVALDFNQVGNGRDLVDSRERVPGSTVCESEGDRTSLCERHGLTHTSVVRGTGTGPRDRVSEKSSARRRIGESIQVGGHRAVSYRREGMQWTTSDGLIVL